MFITNKEATNFQLWCYFNLCTIKMIESLAQVSYLTFLVLSRIIYILSASFTFASSKISLVLCRRSHSQLLHKIGILRKLATFTDKQLCWSFFIKKLQRSLYKKRKFFTGIFLWILQGFQETLFYIAPPGDCITCFYIPQMYPLELHAS